MFGIEQAIHLFPPSCVDIDILAACWVWMGITRNQTTSGYLSAVWHVTSNNMRLCPLLESLVLTATGLRAGCGEEKGVPFSDNFLEEGRLRCQFPYLEVEGRRASLISDYPRKYLLIDIMTSDEALGG